MSTYANDTSQYPSQQWWLLLHAVFPAELKVVSILSDITSESDATITSVQERAEQIGYGTFAILFAILFAVLDIGFVIVRVAGLAALSGSPGLAVGLPCETCQAKGTRAHWRCRDEF
ncbi:hypothetical protein L210DRAFT_948749 [Boletus edulis BED1]|uniref:Uncharacterized protein n=1 Tax=Boletus edulis BED1 TaxID=1328754 RepID=A0AAD4BVT4_BOLED|nr:hypothetical protein L210DRAFT_948749 [Boletus edulis BED1]